MREASGAMMMKHPAISALPALALLALAACDNKPIEVDSRAPDPMAAQLNAAAPVELPPSVSAKATLRCKDNSLIYVDFFQGNTQVNLRTDKAAPPTQLKAAKDGDPFTGGGYTISGTPKSVEYTAPGKAAQTCKA